MNWYGPGVVGVPKIWPVAEFKFRPVGVVPVHEYVREPEPQQKFVLYVTGTLIEASASLQGTLEEICGLVGELIVMPTDRRIVCPPGASGASISTVTPKLPFSNGVPLITPVLESNTKPEGNLPKLPQWYVG
jgi:hypothetical protein